MSYNFTSFDNTLMLSPHMSSNWVIISTPSDVDEAEPPSPEHSRVSKLTDFVISVKRS